MRYHRIATVVVAVAAAAVVTACASSQAPSTGNTNAPAAVAATSPAQTTQQQLATWYQDGGKAGLADFVTAAHAAQAASANYNLPALGQACTQFMNAVTTIQTAGPVPYAPAEQWMAKALAQYASGAAECQAGVQGDNAPLLLSAAKAISTGNTDLSNATSALNGISGA